MTDSLIVGVTGGIGSGKTTVCKIFHQLGVPIYFADDRGKYLLSNDELLKSQVMDLFGAESYLPDGLLNRSFLANRVFSNTEELSKLNGLVHPAVAKDFLQWANNQNAKVLIKEAALLIENGSYTALNKLISVLAPEDVRINRVLMRDIQRDKAQVLDIMSNQVDDKGRREVSDYLIDNGGSKLLIPQVLKIHKELQLIKS
ncbi:dephospho-CoA kinase [Roseivirga ehrenbergii]|uniref:Dephospho-CoA kinase n=1 Tax=Roseivirga ehrenbergii (strain DSM 102268 / JCM 13514 / KCTC 12282 / NCIMB 14502 / KMM 6017) TaxID=279360 RepID=A0A150XTJ3_ROSEK|nr:dephospho-CoA kinase [Roseivirga ehrenbergii]KYG82043.1 dephospho-CoA kinase [Roseivirga ehrenbergii]TCL01864.1 dephospho-CoA kinase [Roseivirga ehrenbergii]